MKALSLLISLYFLVFSAFSSAALIHSVNLNSTDEGMNQIFDKLTFNLNVGEIDPFMGNIAQYEFSENDIGNSIFFNSGESFRVATDFLTNGVDDELSWFLLAPAGGLGSISTESEFLFDGLGNQVDFFGTNISAFELIINNTYFISPGDNLNSDDIWTNYGYDLTLNIHGATAVPEPSTYLLFLIALILTVMVRNNKNRLLR